MLRSSRTLPRQGWRFSASMAAGVKVLGRKLFSARELAHEVLDERRDVLACARAAAGTRMGITERRK